MSISDNVRIRKANKSDLDAVVNIYDEIHQAEEEGIISVGWIRGIYPVKETAEEGLKRDDLFVIEKDGIILGSGIINKIQVDVYKNAKWEHEVEKDKVCVLHTLTISPRAGKKGLGKQFVSFYEDYALENGCSELRIDTNERNTAARKMYIKLRYKEVAIVPTVFNGIPDVNLVLLEKYMGFKKIMKIRKAGKEDFNRIMEIYAYARRFMAEHGNPNQWGPTNWPPEELIKKDIEKGLSYVCENEAGKVVGVFYFDQGKDIEPNYKDIEDGEWIGDNNYGVVHRIATDGSEKGIGAFCINWAFEKCGHLRIDTHGDNVVMQNLLKKLGFTRCGTIYVEEDDYPRIAFEKIRD